MSAAKHSYSALNTTQAIPELAKPCSITTPPGTDVYDKPPSTHRFDAPIFYTRIRKSSFQSVSTSITARWTQKYDQGGLIIFFTSPRDHTRRWIKTGIEFLDGSPRLSVVTKDNWADWSLHPLADPNSRGDEGGAKANIALELGSEDGALWIVATDGSGNKVPLREVTWWEDIGDEVEISAGPYVAKPSLEGGELAVKFEGYELKTV